MVLRSRSKSICISVNFSNDGVDTLPEARSRQILIDQFGFGALTLSRQNVPLQIRSSIDVKQSKEEWLVVSQSICRQ